MINIVLIDRKLHSAKAENFSVEPSVDLLVGSDKGNVMQA
jgi:hypothetical protein